MNQQFVQYIHDAERLAPRFKRFDWGEQLSVLFWTFHQDLWQSDQSAYAEAFKQASDEVSRDLGVKLQDKSYPF